MTEPSKTVTLKVPLWALAGCMDLIEATGENPRKLTYGQIVGQTIEAFISNLIEKGGLPNYDSAELRAKFRAKESRPDPLAMPDMDEVQMVQTDGPHDVYRGMGRREEDSSMGVSEVPHSECERPRQLEGDASAKAFELAQQIEKEILGEQDPTITQEVTLNTDVPPVSVAPATINLYRLPHLSTSELLSRAPRDRFVALMHSDKADPLIKQAIRVLYNSLPVELWGTPLAESQITLLIQRHDGSEN